VRRTADLAIAPGRPIHNITKYLLDRRTLSRTSAFLKSGVNKFVYPTLSRITDEFLGGHK